MSEYGDEYEACDHLDGVINDKGFAGSFDAAAVDGAGAMMEEQEHDHHDNQVRKDDLWAGRRKEEAVVYIYLYLCMDLYIHTKRWRNCRLL